MPDVRLIDPPESAKTPKEPAGKPAAEKSAAGPTAAREESARQEPAPADPPEAAAPEAAAPQGATPQADLAEGATPQSATRGVTPLADPAQAAMPQAAAASAEAVAAGGGSVGGRERRRPSVRGPEGESVGARLRDARTAAGLTVDQASEATSIRPLVLERIERDDFSRCGGAFYARGHVRTLARVYGADEADLLARFDAVQSRPSDPAEDPTRYVPNRGQPHSPHVAPATGVANSLVPPEEPEGGYHKYTLSKSAKRRGRKKRPVDGERRGPNWSAAMGAALAVVIVALILQQFSSHSGGTKTASAATTHAATATGSPRASATHAAPPPHTTSPPTTPANEFVVTISAVSSASWLSVTDASGQNLFRNELAIGQSQRFTDTKKLTLIIGDAGAVKVIVNGTALGSLGSAGQVVTVSFVPGSSSPA